MKIKGLLVLVAAASTAASAMLGAPIGGLDVMPPEACFAPGTPQDVLRMHARRRAARISSLQANPGFQFADAARWGTTATDGNGLTQGQVTTITWNIVADGTPIGALGGIAGESTAPSNLKAFLDGIYPGGEQRPHRGRRQHAFVVRDERRPRQRNEHSGDDFGGRRAVGRSPKGTRRGPRWAARLSPNRLFLAW